MSKKIWIFLVTIIFFSIFFFTFPELFSSVTFYVKTNQAELLLSGVKSIPAIAPLDTVAYDKKINEIANNPAPEESTTKIVKDPKTGVETTVIVPPKPTPPNIWPIKTVYPNAGAILPFNRIIAYYGNLYSTKMGVLGEYKEEDMLGRLKVEVDKWNTADPETPVVPALHYIAVVAQGSAGKDGKYRARMPSTEIDKVLAIAEKINAIVFLDIQPGFSNVETEVPLLEKYLKILAKRKVKITIAARDLKKFLDVCCDIIKKEAFSVGLNKISNGLQTLELESETINEKEGKPIIK